MGFASCFLFLTLLTGILQVECAPTDSQSISSAKDDTIYPFDLDAMLKESDTWKAKSNTWEEIPTANEVNVWTINASSISDDPFQKLDDIEKQNKQLDELVKEMNEASIVDKTYSDSSYVTYNDTGNWMMPVVVIIVFIKILSWTCYLCIRRTRSQVVYLRMPPPQPRSHFLVITATRSTGTGEGESETTPPGKKSDGDGERPVTPPPPYPDGDGERPVTPPPPYPGTEEN